MWPLLKLYFNPQRYFAAAYGCWKAMLDASVAIYMVFSDFRGRRGWRNTVIWALPRCWERVHMALSLGPDGAGPLSDSWRDFRRSWESIQDEVMTCQDKEHREQLVKAFDMFRISWLKDVNRSTNHEASVSFKRNTIIWFWQNIGNFSGSKATRTKMGISGCPGMGTRLASQCGVWFVRCAVAPLVRRGASCKHENIVAHLEASFEKDANDLRKWRCLKWK